MEEDDVDDPPPFWLHPSSSSSPRRGGSTSSSSSSSPLLLHATLVVAASLVLVFLVLPYFRSSFAKTPQLPNPKPSTQPHSIKKGWDSLNLVLVLFAVICSFLGRTGGGSDNAGSASRTSSMKSSVTPRTPYRSYHDYYYGSGGYSGENRHGGYSRSSSFNQTLTMRNSFSYPDLRLESAWSSYDLDRRRFYDDTSIDRLGFVDGEQIYGLSGSRRWSNDVEVEEVKKVVEDAAAGVSSTGGELVKDLEPPQPQPQPESPLPLPSLPAPPPPQLPAVKSRRKHRRRMSYEGIPQSWVGGDFVDEVPERPPSTPPSPPPPPPPAPAAPVVHRRGSSEEKIGNRNGKKRGGSGSATKEFFQSLGKKKKQRNKSIENFEALLGHPSSLDQHRSTLSPPPSPPSSHSVLQNLFSSKKSRNRNRKTAPHSLPLPSHPPRRTSNISKPNRQKNPQPQPSYNTIIEQGNRSPLIPIPPAPPPPPPFRVPPWKFAVVDRDHVRIKSREPSRISSPDITNYEDDQGSVGSIGSLSLTSSPTSVGTMTPNVKGEEDAMMFCSSPDVDMKADKFIARFREGLKLEKMDSWNQRQGTPDVRSNLGPARDQ